jgi:myo-inositol-1(or 4)-monophosphatase
MPEHEKTYYAMKDKGAYMNEEKLKINKEKKPEKSYYVLSGVGKNKIVEDVDQLNSWIQMFGSPIVGEVFVASGKNDIGLYTSLAPWDMATGKIIIEEAGGVVLDIQEETNNWNNVKEGKCIFGNPKTVNNVLNNISKEIKNKISNTNYNC